MTKAFHYQIDAFLLCYAVKMTTCRAVLVVLVENVLTCKSASLLEPLVEIKFNLIFGGLEKRLYNSIALHR